MNLTTHKKFIKGYFVFIDKNFQNEIFVLKIESKSKYCPAIIFINDERK